MHPASCFAALCLAACVVESPHDRGFVAMELTERVGASIRPAGDDAALPPDVALDDGLTETEAVAIALWNNPGFAAVLADLEVSRGELAAAGMFRNPVLSMLFPLGPKQLEATLSLPLDGLLHRPQRIAAARLEVERVAADLVRSGLDLIRDTRVAFGGVLHADERAALADAAAALLDRRAALARRRAAAGEASEAVAAAAAVDAGRARHDAGISRHEAVQARHRLRALLGMDPGTVLPIDPAPEPDSAAELPDLAMLLQLAMAARPDLRAAELALQAAGERAGLASREIWQVALLADMNGLTREADQIGPGLTVEVPLFHQRQGAVDKASAEVQRAALQLAALRFAITQEVTHALQQAAAARAELAELTGSLVPSMEREIAVASQLVASGEESEDVHLAAQQRGLDVRGAVAAASARRHDAQTALVRAIGRRLP